MMQRILLIIIFLPIAHSNAMNNCYPKRNSGVLSRTSSTPTLSIHKPDEQWISDYYGRPNSVGLSIEVHQLGNTCLCKLCVSSVCSSCHQPIAFPCHEDAIVWDCGEQECLDCSQQEDINVVNHNQHGDDEVEEEEG